MGKENEPTEFRVTTKEGVVLYEGFERILAVKTYYYKEANKQFERKGTDDWKIKFYKPDVISIERTNI